MNDSELNNLLRRARVPERENADWKDFPEDTMRRLRSSEAGAFNETPDARGTRRPAVWKSVAAWACSGAAACVLIGFAVGQWNARRSERHNEVAEARKLFSELSAMFPNQLQAVVLDGATPRLVLTKEPMASRGTPLFVRFCGAKGCQRVITFSGERVLLNGENCEVLVDARGHVIIAGERFAWSSNDSPSRNAKYQIEATALTGML